MSSAESAPQATIAVIGGGLAGVSATRALLDMGLAVHLFDMGKRGPGGRASTRKVDQESPALQFDHGCQFIRAADPELTDQLIAMPQGVVAPWEGRLGQLDAETGTFTPRSTAQEQAASSASRSGSFCNFMEAGVIYVGVPGMDAACRGLGSHPRLVTRFSTRVTGADRSASTGLWRLETEGGGADSGAESSAYHGVILADPMTVAEASPGTMKLGGCENAALVQRLRRVEKTPVYSLMVALRREELSMPFDGASVANSPAIQWISRDTSKPGRQRDDGLECLVAVTTEALARALIEQVPMTRDGAYVPQTQAYLQGVAPGLWAELCKLLGPFPGGAAPEPVYMHAQRWGGGFKTGVLSERCLVDEQLRLAACGDFCVESSARGALLSGVAAADAVGRLLAMRM